MRPAYRVWQMVANLTARPTAADWQNAARYLSPQQELMFRNLSAADQAHSLRVMHTLLAADEQDPDLLAAALLHDVGKAKFRQRPWERAAAVVFGWLAPEWAARWGRGRPIGWRRPFVVARQHPLWGASALEQVGSSRRLIWLVRHHQDEPEALGDGESVEQLRRLQQADDKN
ncbi:MAG: HD domain-containing protein [Anaerolineales bacterium]